jgi:UDP-N-acetylglucosamine--N-acetylmuramyl-(pentapeptide) pyrophosphoryl-undecaprenol N-acetylglucosamine transferase
MKSGGRSVRLLICAGGTGGGVYPALAVLRALENEADPVMWVGGAGGMEADLVRREKIPFTAIPAAGVHGVGLRALPGNLVQLGQGFMAARRILRQYQPDALFFTGGYVAVPVALAGRHIPVLLYVPDVEPGLALRALASFADRIAVTTQDSREYYGPQAAVTVTGYPVRKSLTQWARELAVEALDLSTETPTLLVFGGSKGARTINRALLSSLPHILAEMQVVHLSGTLDWSEVEAYHRGLPLSLQGRYRPFPYLHERMGAALAAADLVLSRAGASALGEFPAFGLPAILVPYPFAWRYQRVNAEFLVDRGGAVMLEDRELPDRLSDTVLEIMKDHAQRKAMGAAMRSLARPGAAAAIAEQLKELAADVSRG